MRIYNVNSFSFMAKPATVNHNKNLNNIHKEYSKQFYDQIEKYLKEEINTEQYLNNFEQIYNKIGFKAKMSTAELKYTLDMLMTIDMEKDFNKIPRNHITNRMEALLELMNKKPVKPR